MNKYGMRTAGAAAALLLGLGLAACGGDEEGSASEPDGDASSAAPSGEPSSLPDDSGEPSAGMDDGDGTGPTTLVGVISPGVESGCVLLEYEGVTYNLVGPEVEQLASGQQVEVTGTVVDDLMTMCQQGTPFQVEQVVSAE